MTGPNPLAAVRAEAKTMLEDAGLNAHTTVPERISPPSVWVAPDDPYVTFEGATFGGRIVHLSLVCVAPAGTNDKQADELDALALKVCAAVDESESFVCGEVGQPGQVVLNGQPYLACAVSAVREIHI